MKKHRNIPFFVPFAGCPNRCTFCQQEKITGTDADPLPESEAACFDRMMQDCQGISDSENQIAFFGGSFTGLPRERMCALLERASYWIERGLASSVRISTRPDCIDREVLSILKAYCVTDVELGVQSMDDAVLLACRRGHTAGDSRRAAALLQEEGFRFTGQMMIGLPRSYPKTEYQTAKELCAMGAVEARIYPTVVFAGTELYRQTLAGTYQPLTDIEAAERIAPCLDVFWQNGVKLLKIGLQSSEAVTDAPFGARDGSIGELSYGVLYADRLISEAGNRASGKSIRISVAPRDLSKWTGHGGFAVQRVKKALSASSVQVRPDASVPANRYQFAIIEESAGR